VPVSFHLDEHISTALAHGLRHRAIDVTTTADAGLVGAADREHLAFATAAGRILITQDIDFLRLHASGVHHAGIAYCHPQSRSVGEMLRRLVLLHAALSPEDMQNRVEYL
jgi:hypothetical protein